MGASYVCGVRMHLQLNLNVIPINRNINNNTKSLIWTSEKENGTARGEKMFLVHLTDQIWWILMKNSPTSSS